MTILVTGVRGQVGRTVLDGLVAAGATVRAGSRAGAPESLPEGVEAMRVDLADPASWPAALDGVRRIFLYAQPDGADAFAAAARGAGVEHVVLLSSGSVLSPDTAASPVGQRHVVAERALDGAGLARTFLRAGYFATNTLRWRSIRTERAVRTAFPEGITSPVHERDIVEVALQALLADAPRSAAHPLLGPGPSTVREQVAAIAEALGEPVRLDEVSVDAYRAELLADLPEPMVDRLIAARGSVPLVPGEVAVDAVPEVLGRPATPFAVWARDHAEDFR